MCRYFEHVSIKQISVVMHAFMLEHPRFLTVASALYLDFARDSFKCVFLISNISVDNIALSLATRLREIWVELACPRGLAHQCSSRILPLLYPKKTSLCFNFHNYSCVVRTDVRTNMSLTEEIYGSC